MTPDTHPAKLSKKAARELRERIARAYPFVACASCDNGWVSSGKPGDYSHSTAWLTCTRCACWHVHQAKIQRLLGQAAAAKER